MGLPSQGQELGGNIYGTPVHLPTWYHGTYTHIYACTYPHTQHIKVWRGVFLNRLKNPGSEAGLQFQIRIF